MGLWCISEAFPVGPEKGGIVFKAAFITCICDLHTAADQVPCHEKPFGGHILANGISRLLLKGMHEIIPVQIKGIGEKVNADILGQMFIQVIQNRNDFWIGCGVCNIFNSIADGSTVELYHEFQKQDFMVQLICIFLTVEGTLQFRYDVSEFCGMEGRNPQYMGAAFVGALQAEAQIIIFLLVGIEKYL